MTTADAAVRHHITKLAVSPKIECKEYLRQAKYIAVGLTPPLFEIMEHETMRRRRRFKNRSVAVQPDFLELPSLHVLTVNKREPYYEVETESSSRPSSCSGCGAPGNKLHRHDSRLQRIKDVPVREKPVLILIHRDRYRCSECGHVTRPPLVGIDHRRGITERLLERIEMDCLEPDKTFRSVARKYGVDEKCVRKIFMHLIKRLSRSWRFEAPRFLGIDEVYIEGTARCVLTDVKNRRLVNILPKRDMLTLRRYLLQIKHPERIEVVVIDMWRPYYDEICKRFPKAVIVIDKYHVLRMATEGVISVHRRLRRGNKNLRLPKIFLLRKRKHALPEERLKELENRLGQLSELKEAHNLKEAFFNIWNSLDRQDAAQRIDEWVESIPAYLLDDFKDLLSALKNWREEILNYFDYRVTNAFTESINAIIKHMQRLGRGYTFEVTRAKLIYGGPFSAQEMRACIESRPRRSRRDRAAKSKRKAKRADAPPNPQANVQQLKQIRRSEDEFNELMRPPVGFVERFKHFKQLDLNF